MATVGSIDVNLDKISNTVNSGTEIGANVTSGIADESESIGTAVGITIVVVLFLSLILLVLGIPQKILAMVKGLGKN